MTPGTYRLGPDDGKLTVRTGKTGAAAKAGHNLLIEVTSWSAELTVGSDPADTAMSLSADAGSLVVLEGTGGIQALGDDDKASIKETIHNDVLKGCPIEFRSTNVTRGDGSLNVAGELELFGSKQPLSFHLSVTDDKLAGSAKLNQSDFGVKPFSALFGTLKVTDEVEVAVVAGVGVNAVREKEQAGHG
jgi:polyisoprenoid-binding protein YceI